MAAAQQGPPAPTFDAASIKPSTATDGHQHIYFDDPTHVRFINQPLDRLIEFAYGITDREFVGPDWLGTEPFDISAATAAPSGRQQMYDMLRTFLAQQFKLQVHHEIRQAPVYSLIVAKGEIKADRSATNSGNTSMGAGPVMGHIEMTSTVGNFAHTLANYTDRPVIDQTGVDGIYHFYLLWTLDRPLNNSATPDPNGPPQLFTAIEEQLGLKLVPQRGPVDTIVVDHCDKTPAGN